MKEYPWDQIEPIQLFSDFVKVIGIAHLGPEKYGEKKFFGKKLGVLNGSAWIMLWASYFGRRFLPGVHLVNAGNEAMQLNFMKAHKEGKPTPPQSNIDTMVRYALDLVELADVDAVIITCSTMNRSYPAVSRALEPYGVPVIQIDRPMMERAVERGGRVLVVATHGPTVKSTQSLLKETAEELGKDIEFSGLHIEEPWEHLENFDIKAHNESLAEAVRKKISEEDFDSVVFAQLSMTAFLLSCPEPEKEFGIPIFTSGQCGFETIRDLFLGMDDKS